MLIQMGCVIDVLLGQPPHADKNPIRAMYMIPHAKPPTLAAPQDFSPLFSDFLSKCLVKKPSDRYGSPPARVLMHCRPTATAVLTHKFVAAAAPPPSMLQSVLDKAKNAKKDPNKKV